MLVKIMTYYDCVLVLQGNSTFGFSVKCSNGYWIGSGLISMSVLLQQMNWLKAVCPSSPVTVFSFGTVACKAGHVRSHVVRRGDATPTATARATLVGNPPQRLHRRVGGWSGLAKMQLPLGTLFVARVYTHIDTNTHIHKHAYIRA